MDMILQLIKSVHSWRSMSTENITLKNIVETFCDTQCWNVVDRLEEKLEAAFQSCLCDHGEIDSICMFFYFDLTLL